MSVKYKAIFNCSIKKAKIYFPSVNVNVPICVLVHTVEFLWSHTTESMCVGYMSAQDGKAKVSGKTGSQPENLVASACASNQFVEADDFSTS